MGYGQTPKESTQPSSLANQFGSTYIRIIRYLYIRMGYGQTPKESTEALDVPALLQGLADRGNLQHRSLAPSTWLLK